MMHSTENELIQILSAWKPNVKLNMEAEPSFDPKLWVDWTTENPAVVNCRLQKNCIDPFAKIIWEERVDIKFLTCVHQILSQPLVVPFCKRNWFTIDGTSWKLTVASPDDQSSVTFYWTHYPPDEWKTISTVLQHLKRLAKLDQHTEKDTYWHENAGFDWK